MKISVDGGALCSPIHNRFGNYVFTQNLIQALSIYEKEHRYIVYSFCEKPAWLNESEYVSYVQSRSSTFWLKGRVSFEEVMRKNDIFLALNQSIPPLTPSRIISFSHGLSFYFFKQFYRDSYTDLKKQLDTIVKKSQNIIVSSQKVKEEIVSMYRYIDTNSIKILSFGMPLDMRKQHTLKTERKNFFLFVGMNHPIKNVRFIISAFENFIKDKRFRHYKLYLVGNFDRIYNKRVYCFKSVKRAELREFYQQATAYLSASYYESFNLPVLEALSQGCQVIGLDSAIIPELKQYVFTVSNKDFAEIMKAVAMGEVKKINVENLKNEFSWRKYVEKLTVLF